MKNEIHILQTSILMAILRLFINLINRENNNLGDVIYSFTEVEANQ
ncbi:MAG TPA: hypothetical protein VJ962_12750 [Clostridia bacterium]|nr:hypothetical protein [Clostridia bacterium]